MLQTHAWRDKALDEGRSSGDCGKLQKRPFIHLGYIHTKINYSWKEFKDFDALKVLLPIRIYFFGGVLGLINTNRIFLMWE